jgi:hypothetical protein
VSLNLAPEISVSAAYTLLKRDETQDNVDLFVQSSLGLPDSLDHIFRTEAERTS